MLAAQGVTMAVDEKRMKEVDGAHGPAEDMAPFLPCRSTEEASFISGAVFAVTGNGRVTLYFDPEPTAEIKKDGAPWSVDKLIETMPLPCSRTYAPRRRATMGMLFAVRGDRADQHTAVRGTPPETRRAAGPTTR